MYNVYRQRILYNVKLDFFHKTSLWFLSKTQRSVMQCQRTCEPRTDNPKQRLQGKPYKSESTSSVKLVKHYISRLIHVHLAVIMTTLTWSEFNRRLTFLHHHQGASHALDKRVTSFMLIILCLLLTKSGNGLPEVSGNSKHAQPTNPIMTP
jgi:hypothetical protein